MKRLAIAVCCYAAIFAAAFFVALQLRFDLNFIQFLTAIVRNHVSLRPAPGFVTAFQVEQLAYAKDVFREGAITLLFLKMAVVLLSRDWRRRLRYSTTHDVAWSAGICLASGALIAGLQVFPRIRPDIPRGVIIIDTILCAGAMVSARVLANMLRTIRIPGRNTQASRTLIYANGEDAVHLVTSIRSSSTRLRVVGIVSLLDAAKKGVVAGVQVFDASAGLDQIIQQTSAEVLLLPSQLTGRTIREVSEICRRNGVEAHLVPSVDEIPSGRFQLRMRDITIDDLLRREPNQLDLNGIRTVLQDRVILVTGAAGSIGSEVCRQLLSFGPRRIILLDQSEFGIFQMEQEFQNVLPMTEGALVLDFVVEDITDLHAMTRLFMLYRPAVVFHAAAYKHVPLMETNPQAAVRNNVFGTRVLVDLAHRFSVERFVMISTDKAVRPTNVMGATKLIAEQYLHFVASSSKTRFITVRFGNVLNSAGSVVPTFRRQIQEGGPITVTDPEMLRYFMTIPEAVQLVLQSGAIGQGGDVLILDMGDPVKIVDLAKDMIRLSGQEYPQDIDIVYTGLRPGEKLYEELFYETEENAGRIHDKIFRAARQTDTDVAVISDDLQRLSNHLHAGREELREVLWQVTARIVESSSASQPHHTVAMTPVAEFPSTDESREATVTLKNRFAA